MLWVVTVLYMARAADRHQVLYTIFGLTASTTSILYVVYVVGSCPTYLARNKIIQHIVEVVHIYLGVLFQSSPCIV